MSRAVVILPARINSRHSKAHLESKVAPPLLVGRHQSAISGRYGEDDGARIALGIEIGPIYRVGAPTNLHLNRGLHTKK